MTPVDVKPSRMDRARFKMHDFLRETKDGQNALILYDNEPFVAVPLTTDQKVVEQILPTVQAGMMGGRMPGDGGLDGTGAEGETDSIYGKNHLVDSQALRPNHAGKKDPIKEAENP